MTTQAETFELPIEITLPKGVSKNFQKAKDVLTETVNTLTESAQQAKQSLTETSERVVNTVTEASDKAVDSVAAKTQEAVDTFTTVTSDSVKTVTETIEQSKGSVGQIKNTTSEAIQTAIASSIHEWLQAHPAFLRLLHIFVWATNHPIFSLVILLFTVAIAGSLIKAIGRLIETTSLSILKAPFKLLQLLFGVSFQSIANFGGLAFKQLTGAKNAELPALPDSNSLSTQQDKQQRLAEISSRLEAIQKEQNELLQEVAAILNSNKIDIEV
jgi:hypothetical protein